MTFDEILRFLSGPGVQAAIGFVLLTFVPDVFSKQWEEVVPPKWRRPIVAMMCFVIPVLAAMLRVWLGFVPFDVDGILIPALLAGGAAYMASSVMTGLRKLPTTRDFRAVMRGMDRGLAAKRAPVGARAAFPQRMKWSG